MNQKRLNYFLAAIVLLLLGALIEVNGLSLQKADYATSAAEDGKTQQDERPCHQKVDESGIIPKLEEDYKKQMCATFWEKCDEKESKVKPIPSDGVEKAMEIYQTFLLNVYKECFKVCDPYRQERVQKAPPQDDKECLEIRYAEKKKFAQPILESSFKSATVEAKNTKLGSKFDELKGKFKKLTEQLSLMEDRSNSLADRIPCTVRVCVP